MFKGVASVAIVWTSILVSACGGGSGDATPPVQDQKTAASTSGEEAPPGRLTIRAATVSGGSESAALAFDHDPQKAWNSNGPAPGWIQLDLGQPTTIARVRLLTAQSPPGATIHQVTGGLTPDNLAPLGTLDGDTADSQWLELKTNAQVRYLRVSTVKSPSWVAWNEIEIYQ